MKNLGVVAIVLGIVVVLLTLVGVLTRAAWLPGVILLAGGYFLYKRTLGKRPA